MECFCFFCSTTNSLDGVYRNTQCQKCQADLHICYNCTNYDESAINSCLEKEAENIQIKDCKNFCEYFKASATPRKRDNAAERAAALKKLDSLFE
jgi:hypothetical protein